MKEVSIDTVLNLSIIKKSVHGPGFQGYTDQSSIACCCFFNPFSTRGARAYRELLQGQGYANESLAHS